MSEQQSSRRADLAALRIDRGEESGAAGGRRLWVWLAAGGLLIVVVLAAGFVLRRPPEVTVAVVKAPPESGRLAVLNASGYVTPRLRATVAAKVTGRVVEVLVEEGMEVSAGQVLARLDDTDARRRLTAAEADRKVSEAALEDLEVQLANARRELERARALQEEGFGSVQALDAASTAAESLAARLQLARERVGLAAAQEAVLRQDLENYVIRSPFSGIAVSKDAQPGEMVSPVSAGGGFTRTGISTIVDMSSLEIEVDVNEAYIARVAPGQRVEAVLDAYPDWRMPARVRTVIPTADRQRATVKVRISFNALDPRILPDMGVKVAFLEAASSEDEGPPVRGVVPQAALRTDGQRQVVFVLEDGIVRRRAVTVGRMRGGEAEIVAGLSAGEQVITAGPAGLQDGARVRVAGSR